MSYEPHQFFLTNLSVLRPLKLCVKHLTCPRTPVIFCRSIWIALGHSSFSPTNFTCHRTTIIFFRKISPNSGNQLFLMTPVCLLGVLLHKKRSFHIFSSVEVYTCFYMMLIRFKNLSDTKDSKQLYRILGKI